MLALLPIEILLEIFDRVYAHRDVRSMLSLCLVSHTLYPLAARYLYRDIDRYLPRRSPTERCVQLHLTLAQHRELGPLVQKITPLPNFYKVRLFMPAILRLAVRNLRNMPNLKDLTFISTMPGLRCNSLLGLPANVRRLAVFAHLDDTAVAVLEEQRAIRVLSFLDMGPQSTGFSDQWSLLPALDRLSPSTALSQLEELTCPIEVAVRLLPGRSIRNVSIPHAMDQPGALRLAHALSKALIPPSFFRLFTLAFNTLAESLPPLALTMPTLQDLYIDFLRIDENATLEMLDTDDGVALLKLLPELQHLHLAFSLRARLLNEDHQPLLRRLQGACPALKTVTLSVQLRGNSVKYERLHNGEGESRWVKMWIISQNQGVFYAA